MREVLITDWSGILLMLLTFLIVYRYWSINRDNKLSFVLGLLVFFHQVIAVVNIYIFTLPGAEGDPLKFYYFAKNWAIDGKFTLAVGTKFYTQFLGMFFRIFGPSKLLGEELSILFFLFSCIILIKIIKLIDIKEYTIPILLIYGLLPTNLIFCSKILRESYQLYFFMASIYWGLRFKLESSKNALMFCIVSALLMGLFQKALITYVLILIPLLLLWPIQTGFDEFTGKKNFQKRKIINIVFMLIAVFGIIIMGIWYGVGDMDAARSFLTGNGFQYAAKYREKLILATSYYARANYGILLNTSSPIELVKSALHIYIYYMFMPFPWQISNWLDVYGCFEAIMRIVFILFSILLFVKEKNKTNRSIYVLLLFIYVSMTFLWAMGSVNYGQAIRHHLLTNWIIITLGVHGFTIFLNDHKLKNLTNSKNE